jgi:hypothetical protein
MANQTVIKKVVKGTRKHTADYPCMPRYGMG